LPLIDFDGRGWSQGGLASYVDAARQLGYSLISANDHPVFQRPWLDCIVALASVIDRSGEMGLATTVSLPVVRGPAALAKAAAALDVLSGGRLALGVGPGSSVRDYETAHISFDERWPRLDEAIRVLRAQLKTGEPPRGSFLLHEAALEPRRTGPRDRRLDWQLGFDAGPRRVARLGDGWLARVQHSACAGSAGERSSASC
jgi:alkanesulfonate monooxygenase SsuD/methylene tetrahydromethanopterin reductase-like flavin-dependent oxidoreductase (luciferase family)